MCRHGVVVIDRIGRLRIVHRGIDAELTAIRVIMLVFMRRNGNWYRLLRLQMHQRRGYATRHKRERHQQDEQRGQDSAHSLGLRGNE